MTSIEKVEHSVVKMTLPISLVLILAIQLTSANFYDEGGIGLRRPDKYEDPVEDDLIKGHIIKALLEKPELDNYMKKKSFLRILRIKKLTPPFVEDFLPRMNELEGRRLNRVRLIKE